MSATLSPDDMYEAFIHGRLAKNEWTHEAHLTACWKTLEKMPPVEALPFLRESITTHNCGVGTANNATSGYHETITRYFITAIHNADATTLDEVLADPTLGRDSALRYWSRDVLMSSQARLGWLAPDLIELPWSIVSDD